MMVPARFHDGRSTRIYPVVLSAAGDQFVIEGEEVHFTAPFASVRVDERLGRAARRVRFADGSFCEVHDLTALDGLLAAAGHQDGWVDRIQRRAKTVALAMLACALLAVVGYRWGLPWAAAVGARHLPVAVGVALSDSTLKALDGSILLPSQLAADRQTSLRTEFRSLRLPEGGKPQEALLFRRSSALGANAFTLPDGSIIVTDDLIAAMPDDHEVIAVLSHELGHAHFRHGLQQLLQSSAVGAFFTFYTGDISSLLAAAPAALMQAKYSRSLEQEADDYGAAVLQHNALSPSLLADALKALIAAHPNADSAGFLASHPATDERMRHLRELAR